MLRAMLGITALIHGGMSLGGTANSSVWTWGTALPLIASGTLLLIGFLTPLAGVLVSLGTIASILSGFMNATGRSPEMLVPAIFVFIVAAAVVLLGPGAISLDAYMFGLREITIPNNSRSSKP